MVAKEFSSSDLDENHEPKAEVGPSRNGAVGPKIRDRVRELRRVRARDLLSNPKNWRRHPKAQADALRGLYAEIGCADALLARELQDGRLMLIDGHLRAEITPTRWCPS
jgi:hypothetical protein